MGLGAGEVDFGLPECVVAVQTDDLDPRLSVAVHYRALSRNHSRSTTARVSRTLSSAWGTAIRARERRVRGLMMLRMPFTRQSCLTLPLANGQRWRMKALTAVITRSHYFCLTDGY